MQADLLDRRTVAYVALTSFFVASLTASNYLASKIFSLGEIGGITLLAPAAVAAYALTFTFTDIISEVFGRRAASMTVRIGFVTQILVLLYGFVALKLKAAPISPVDDATFSRVVGAQASIITASLIAYLVSQHHDVWAFHFWKRKTGGRWLWLRNNLSTLVSQAIDTAIFITLAFSILPPLFGGQGLPLSVAWQIILGQYLVKAAIAIGDTPLVYLGVMLTQNYIGAIERAAATAGITGAIKQA